MTNSKALVETLKDDQALMYSAVNYLNDSAKRLSTLIQTSLSNIARHTKAARVLVNTSSDQEASSGPQKLDLSKIPIHSSNGLFIESGRIKRLPHLTNTVRPQEVIVTGSGDSYITVDESGEKLVKPVVYFPSDIVNGLEFQYQDNGLILLSMDFIFPKGSLISIIAFNTGDSYSGKQTKIESVFLSDSRSVKFTTVKTGSMVYILFDTVVDSSILTVKVSSSAYVSKENTSLLRFKSIQFGLVTYQSVSTMVLGPIGSNTLKIIKAGIAVDTVPTNIRFKVSSDAATWYNLDQENEKGYVISLDTIFTESRGIKTNRIFVGVEIEDTMTSSVIENLQFVRYAGEDCYDTTLEFGNGSISNLIINDYLQSVYDTTSEKYVYPGAVDPLKNYRVTMMPYNPVMPSETFQHKYNTHVVTDPNSSIAYIYGALSDITTTSTQFSHFVYKKKDDYTPGKYSYVINGEGQRSFDVYGDYELSLSRFILKVLKTDTVIATVEHEGYKRTFDRSSMVTLSISETEEYISMAPIFMFETISYSPAFFYPYAYEDFESVTENGTNVQNGFFVLPYTKMDYPRNKIDDMSSRDLDIYDGFLRKNTMVLDRVKLLRTKHKNIRGVTVVGDKHLVRVQFIDGESEFIERKKAFTQNTITSGEVVIAGIKSSNTVEVYTSGYAKKLIRVYAESDIISDYNFYVQNGKIKFHHNLESEIMNVVYENDVSGRIIGNMYSVNYATGIIYFSSYQNQIEVSYEHLDMVLMGNMYVSKNIATEGVLESLGIETIKNTVDTFKLDLIPSVSIGVIYE